MSDYIYCKCGARIVKGSTRINFCPTCGQSFNKNTSNASDTSDINSQIEQVVLKVIKEQQKSAGILHNPSIKKVNSTVSEVDDLDDKYDDEVINDGNDGESLDYVPEVSDNPFTVENLKPNKVCIGQIWDQNKKIVPVNEQPKRQGVGKINKKKFMEEFKKEAGTSRSRNS